LNILVLIFAAASAFAGEQPAFEFGAGCQSESVDHGKADTMTFSEMKLNCGGLKVRAEISRPVTEAAVARQMLNETIMVQESYSATRNPYAGFISDTAQCPTKNNFSKEEFKFMAVKRPLLTGRLTERGTWGACGTADRDLWGAVTFVASGDAMMKVRITSAAKIGRKDFHQRALTVLGAIKAR